MRKIALILALCMNTLVFSTKILAQQEKKVDVLLIGGGIMSATLGTYLHDLEPKWSIEMVERLENVAQESSNGWNNAGTGHAALAEINYTPQQDDGTIDIKKAIVINESFEISKQFWSYQVQKGTLNNPRSFINNTPHMSFVWGDDNIEFLRKRYQTLQKNPLFQNMEYSEDISQIQQWIPLVMEGRNPDQKVAATRVSSGTDVNFGEITRQLIASLSKSQNFTLHTCQEIRDLRRDEKGHWRVSIADLTQHGTTRVINAKFVFIGAGGAALPLLQKSGIPEGKDYAGFPVGGAFLMTENQDVVKRHFAKVYGKASLGAPPMSVPHLDTRILDGKKVLLFGPFATFSTKFLKKGSLLDMFSSITMSNMMPMIHVGLNNFDLIKYLINQVMLNDEDRYNALKMYFPDAKKEDWYTTLAGQRVQIIKKDKEKGGVLNLGTEVVTSQDGSLSALLGASPGASTSASIMLDLMKKAFKAKMATPEWKVKLKEIIPSYGQKMHGNLATLDEKRRVASDVLQLGHVPMEVVANKDNSDDTP